MIGANSKTCRQEINYPLSTLMLRTFSIENHRNHEHSVLKSSALKKNLNPLRKSINIKGTPSSSPLVQRSTLLQVQPLAECQQNSKNCFA